jgi:hypothetical protein
MIITTDHIRETRLVQYEFKDGPPGDVASVPWMKVEHPGSYAPSFEHLRSESLKVKGCRISLIRRDGMWHLDGIVVQLIRGKDTLIEHVELGSDPVPMWLANLTLQAAQEVS